MRQSTSYDTAIKHLYRKGLEEVIPVSLRKKIPRNNIHRWRNEKEDKYEGCDLNDLAKSEIQLLKAVQNSSLNANAIRKNWFSTCNKLNFRVHYYPFGMQLPNRYESAGDSYRYGFQNQEVDAEVKGEGNSVNYKYRMHDPRIGRFFAVDPLAAKYPHYTPYQFSGNRPIDAIELEGLEEFILINDGSKYTLVWDITARGRSKKGVYNGASQTGTIMVVNKSGDVIEDVRKLTAEELGFTWIKDRRETATPSKKYEGTEWNGQYERGELNHAVDGTKASLGHGSTGFVGDDGWVTRELSNLPLDFNVPKPVPPASTTAGTPATAKSPLTQSTLDNAISGGYSTIGFKSSGGQITPIVNPSGVPGSASSIGSQLNGASFSSLTFNISIFLSDNNSLRWVGSDSQKKAAAAMSNQIESQIASSAGVSKSKINVNFTFTSDPNNQKFNATFKK